MIGIRMPAQLQNALYEHGITPRGWMLWGRLGDSDVHGAQVDGRWVSGPFRSVTAMIGQDRYIVIWHT